MELCNLSSADGIQESSQDRKARILISWNRTRERLRFRSKSVEETNISTAQKLNHRTEKRDSIWKLCDRIVDGLDRLASRFKSLEKSLQEVRSLMLKDTMTVDEISRTHGGHSSSVGRPDHGNIQLAASKEMTLQEQRNKYAESEKIRKTITEGQASLRRLSGDQEIPISTDAPGQEVIAQEKVATSSKKRHKKRVHKGSGSQVVPTPGKGQASSDVQGAESASRKRSFGELEDEPTTEVRATWHHPIYQFPQDKDGMNAVADELGNVPEMIGFDLAVRDPVNSSFGHAAVKRISDLRHVTELELKDPSEVENYAGQALCEIAGTICSLSSQLKKSLKDRADLEKELAKERSKKYEYRKANKDKDSKLTKLNQEKERLLKEVASVHELKDELEKKNEELSVENAQLVANAKYLRDEICRLNEKVVISKRQAVEAYKDSKEFRDDAESAMLDHFNRGVFHVLRVAAAEGLPDVGPEMLAKWGAEPIYSDIARQGHSFVPYNESELLELAQEDVVMNKPAWPMAPIAEPTVKERFVDLADAAGKAWEEARERAAEERRCQKVNEEEADEMMEQLMVGEADVGGENKSDIPKQELGEALTVRHYSLRPK